MRSQLDVRLGVAAPEIRHLPPDVASLEAAREAIELADAYLICDGHPLAENQRDTLEAALGERVDGSWAASRVGDFGPRQGTGKNDKIAARELAGLILFGERLQIHTAHEFPTANEAFLRMVAIFENWDDLRRRVGHIYSANGKQSISLRSGQRLMYRARTGGSGRGFAKADLVVYDEAQHLQREHVAASAPAKLANPNSQSWYAGSGGLSTSAVAWEMRRSALMGTGGRLAYTEKTGETLSVINGEIIHASPDPNDREVWYRAIPGLGRWITEEGVEGLRDELGELFPREGLCVWEPEPGMEQSAVDAVEWRDCADPKHKPSVAPVYALDVSPDGKSTAIAASDGTHVEVVKYEQGTHWVVDACVAKRDAIGAALLLDPAGPAGALIASLQAAGLTVQEVNARQHAQACGAFLADVENRRLRHLDQIELNAAVANADRRDLGDGGWLWSRKKSSVDIAPLVAVTLARWGASSDAPSAYLERGLVTL